MGTHDVLSELGLEATNLGACDGQWVEPATRRELVSVSPVDGEPIASVILADEVAYEKVMATAEAAFADWRMRPAPQRGEISRELGEELRLHQQALGSLVSLEMGKILSEGLGEVQEMIDMCDFAVGLSRQLYGPTMMSERPRHRMYEQWHPLGVVGIIYESRPNVTADAAALCLKSGNATVLRGGSEAFHSNQAIAASIHHGLKAAGLPADAVQVVATTDRAAVDLMVTMPQSIDVIIPRGGKGLIERISAEARVPVIKHLHGVCHVYIDDRADVEKAIRIADNAKTQRYGTCNTMETLLVHEAIAARVLPPLARIYLDKCVELS